MSLLNKIQAVQFEPDWSKAPDSVVSAVAHLAWIDKDGYLLPGYKITTFERPVTPHPHAEMMAKYAEVAARRIDPWVEFEYKCDGQGWTKSTMLISFYENFEYRHIGNDK